MVNSCLKSAESGCGIEHATFTVAVPRTNHYAPTDSPRIIENQEKCRPERKVHMAMVSCFVPGFEAIFAASIEIRRGEIATTEERSKSLHRAEQNATRVVPENSHEGLYISFLFICL